MTVDFLTIWFSCVVAVLLGWAFGHWCGTANALGAMRQHYDDGRSFKFAIDREDGVEEKGEYEDD